MQIVTHTSASLAAALIVLLGACSVTLDPMPDEEPCDAVGYAISSRTLACTGEEQLANARFDQFKSEFTCKPWNHDPDAGGEHGPFACAVQVNALWCDRFTTCKDDLHCLLQDGICRDLLEPSDGQGWHEEQWDAGPDKDTGTPDAGPTPPQQILSSHAWPGDLVQDADYLYFTTRRPGADAGMVVKQAKHSFAGRRLATKLLCDTDAGTSPGPAGLALDTDHVFVAVEGCETVLSLAKDGSSSKTIATFAPGSGVKHIALLNNTLYVGLVSAFKVVAMNTDGTNQRELVTLPHGVVMTGLMATSSGLYWTAGGSGPNLQSSALTGGAPHTLATGWPGAMAPRYQSNHLFFIDNSPSGAVLRLSPDGTNLTPLATKQPNPSGLWATPDAIAWTRQGADEVVIHANNENRVIASAQRGVSFVVMDNTDVFWTKVDPLLMLMRATR